MGMTVSSCIDDDSTYGVESTIPTLAVNGASAGDGEAAVVNGYFGREFVIEPVIDYDGDRELQYEWSVAKSEGGAKGDLQVVSRDPVFRYDFPEGGTWIVQLKLTDGVVGIAQEYKAQVNRTFEAGYCVVSNNAAGEGNLVFLKEMTPEELDEGIEPIVMDDVLGLVCHEETKDEIVGIRVLKLTWPATVTRISVCTSTHCYYLDPSSFTEMSSINYQGVIGGFKAKSYIGFSAKTRAYDPVLKKYVTVDAADMMPYEDSAWKDHAFDAFFGGHYESWGNVNFENYFVQRSPLKVYNQYMKYSDDYSEVYDLWGCSDEVTYEGKTLFDGEELVTAFMGEGYAEGWSNVYPAYFITRTIGGGSYYFTRLSDFGSYSMTPVAVEKRAAIDATADNIPADDSQVALSSKFSRFYYYNGNHVYVMLVSSDVPRLPSASEWALEYPADEEVTFIGIDNESQKGEEVLMVATVNKSTGRGNVYFYDVRNVRTDNPGAAPTATYLDCADRISEVMYKGRN